MAGVHALIIEDHHDSVDVLGRLLTREGISYHAVEQPTQLNPAQLEAVNVVFLDLDMPGMNGYQVFDLLRNTYGVRVPVIAYTVNTNERTTARSLGFNGMLSKPLDTRCFPEQMRQILAGEAVWDDC